MRRRRHERGVSMVEAVIVLPLVVLVLSGTVEFGFAWRDTNRIERALQSAGRTGSGSGDSRYADYEVLRTIDAGLDGMTGASIERVVVFEAQADDGDVPPGCASMAVSPTSTSAQGISGTCNVYSPAQVSTSSPVGFGSSASGDCTASSWDHFFCPTGRTNTGTDLTYLGVYIHARYRPFTSLIPGPTLDIERTTVYRVEPCIPSVQSC